ncbi:MAG: tRNA pseudouridine(55) synthase TruB [Gemmatimonadaceae bacterium]|nr:tRNA pseudouridine(55) synthase TruB [Gemmatimonadaceae bacterium]
MGKRTDAAVEPPDGLLLVDKPAGVTSHDVVGRARRVLGTSRVGHAGTLDPFATGLLVVLYGRATRLLPHLQHEPKVYEATIRFGAETDTEDLGGTVIREASPPSRAAVEAVIPSLTGRIAQVPPAYSAKRVDGVRAYARARAGEVVTLDPVDITVHRWDLLAWRDADGEADVRITCGGGTYIRSLARDLGRLTGSAAHLSALRRVAAGAFRVEHATPMQDLQRETLRPQPALEALQGLPQEALDAERVGKIVRGIDVEAHAEGSEAALTDARTGALVAYAVRRGDRWQPRVVMREV